ncbi:MAG: phage recombination protein Bet [Candidatus Moraniibacteriota bacterium]
MAKEKKAEKKAAKVEAVAVAEPETVKQEEKQEIKVIERIIENREVAPADAFGKLSRPQIELIKRTIAKGATDDELNMFIQVCKGAQLNPFLRQVFLVRRWDSKTGGEVGVIQVGIDGFRAVAEGSGAYAGNDDPLFAEEADVHVKDKAGKVTKTFKAPKMATVTVHKVIGGTSYPFTATARWSEYYPGDRMGFQWQARPYLMLGKCAEALALRKAFPKLLSGMYEAAELDNSQADQPRPPKIEASSDQVFQTLVALVQKSTLEQLKGIKEKVEAPGEKKYTEEQRKQLLALVDARIADLEIPIINQDEES